LFPYLRSSKQDVLLRPEKWWGYPVINGDENDLRFLDGSGKIVGLLEKKTGRKTTDEFIQAV